MNLRIKFSKLNKPKIDVAPRINKELLKNLNYSNTYKQKVNEKQDAKVNKVFVDGEDTWSDIIEDCLEAGKEVLGVKDRFAKKPESK